MSFLARQLITRSSSVLNFQHNFNQGHAIAVPSNITQNITARNVFLNPQTFCLPVLSNVFSGNLKEILDYNLIIFLKRILIYLCFENGL